jgi:hypothetical protein
MRAYYSRLLATFLIVCAVQDAGAQPLAVNPSAARSDISNPSSYNPAAAASDLRNPSAINPAAAASQLPQPSTGVSNPHDDAARPRARQWIAPPPRAMERTTGGRSAGRQADTLTCPARREGIASWEALRRHFAKCWTVPEGTARSSVTLRFMISSVGTLRGPPMITATNVAPKEMSNAYREAAVAVLGKCLPVCPTSKFGESLHDTILHLRLVNDAPFPSRNLGPWMTIFAEHPDKR